MIGFQFFKKLRGPGVDIFREAKWTALFGHPDRPRRPCPFVDVLEKVMMNGAVVAEVQLAFGETARSIERLRFRLRNHQALPGPADRAC